MKKNNIANFLNLDQDSPLKNIEGLPLGIKNKDEDGAIEISDIADGGYYSWGHEFDTNFQNEKELLNKYEEMSLEPYMRDAIADIIDQCVVQEDGVKIVTLNLDNIENKFVNDSYSFQPLISPLKISFWSNIANILDTLLTSQLPMSWLKEVSWNIPAMFVTFWVFQLDMS